MGCFYQLTCISVLLCNSVAIIYIKHNTRKVDNGRFREHGIYPKLRTHGIVDCQYSTNSLKISYSLSKPSFLYFMISKNFVTFAKIKNQSYDTFNCHPIYSFSLFLVYFHPLYFSSFTMDMF